MELIEKTEKYKIVEFSESELMEDKEINFINCCIFNDIKYEQLNENIIKIYNPKYY